MSEERQAFTHNGKTIYEWDQTLEEVNIYIKPPMYTLPKYLAENRKMYGDKFETAKFDIKIESDRLSIGVKGQKPFINVI